MEKKHSRWWLWLLVAAALVVGSLAAYKVLFVSVTDMSLPESVELCEGADMQLYPVYSFSGLESASNERKDKAIAKAGVTFVSENPDIVSVTPDGAVHAAAVGDVNITVATHDKSNITKNVRVIVYARVDHIEAEGVTLDTVHKDKAWSYRIEPSNARYEREDIKIKDSSIATYSDGKIHAKKAGKTEIVVTVDDIVARFPVEVKQVTEKLSVEDISITEGQSAVADVTCTPANAELGTSYRYSIEDKSIASVDDKGNIYGVKEGTTKLIVTNKFDQKAEATVTVKSLYPMVYNDGGNKITITKEWYHDAWCYAAHLQFSDYSRLGSSCANGAYDNGYETASHAASRLGAVFCVNGDYSSPDLHYSVMRGGKVWNDGKCGSPGVYSNRSGRFGSPAMLGVEGVSLTELAKTHAISDTFCFGPAFLVNGSVCVDDDGRAQRTFVGTNGSAGDMWVVVSEGRMVDGVSKGLTHRQCAQFLQEKGCSFGIPLDGGGSSTMVFQGSVLNPLPNGSQRAVVDFLYFKG